MCHAHARNNFSIGQLQAQDSTPSKDRFGAIKMSLGAAEQTELSPKLGICTTKPCEEAITLEPIHSVYTHIHNITF
jgi:hypothetical protein